MINTTILHSLKHYCIQLAIGTVASVSPHDHY